MTDTTNRAIDTVAAADDLDNPVVQGLVEMVERVRALIPEGHHGQHEPGPDLHGWTSLCWPCEIARALDG